ncbi:rhodanese-related sulfurtransferase [Sphingobium boeckii]|uniref:tRNA uridine(34) hydroxylase n=1 Tax=Sphingobium boeckii TaxID=1082345 RepID=A0A7W9AGG0_9SPHN|nr:rhodanese-related sulfurtransferase [Sphingobium boeckii]MBB5685210.1 UPF0176 protein [Sphingobium boeckii]
MTQNICVAALYRFAAFPDPAALRDPLLALCKDQGVKGTLLLATEGINGTIAGAATAVEAVLDHLRTLPDCAALEVKYSSADTMPFHRMKVRIKREIVTMGVEGVDARDPGRYVAPTEWNALISDPDVIVIDTRNDYEVGIGSFQGAINPATTHFGEFPGWFRDYRATLGEDAQPRIAMFCTGGIRCEKATAFLKAEGIVDVSHLKGGILAYLEQMPSAESLWEGECFVFDERVAVGHGVAQGSYMLCRGCRAPVSATDAASPLYVEGVSCPACAGSRDAQQRARYAERQKQVELAEARGETHIGDAETALADQKS